MHAVTTTIWLAVVFHILKVIETDTWAQGSRALTALYVGHGLARMVLAAVVLVALDRIC